MTPRKILLTGVSRGLGRALLDGFIREGHTVYGCARNTSQIEKLQREYSAPHHFTVLDTTDVDAVDAWATEIITSHGTPDLLINNAAIINPNQNLWDVPPESFHQVMSVNINGVFHVLRAFLPAMVKESKGVIVNLSSTWGRYASPQVAPYCASKFAIEGMTQALAEELPKGMAAIPLSPGVVNTDMLQETFGAGADHYISPKDWAVTAVPYLLSLSAKDNGKSLTAP